MAAADARRSILAFAIMMRRTLLIVCLVAVGCYGLQAAQGKSSDELIQILTAPHTTRQARKKAAEKLALKPPSDVLPKLLEVRRKYGHTISMWGMDEFAKGWPVSWEQAAAITAGYAWSGNLDNPSYTNEVKGAALHDLMRREKDLYARARFLFDLKFHWVEGAEVEASTILTDSQAEPLARYIAGAVLLDVTAMKYYGELYSAALDAPLENREGFAGLLLRKRTPPREGRVLRYAFAVIQAQCGAQPGRLDCGYQVASSIGHYVGIEFAPNQYDPKYKGEHGLADAFFIETVVNALRWWEKNKSDYQE